MADEKDLAGHNDQAEHTEVSGITSPGNQPLSENAEYWFSLQFIGTLLGIMLLANSLFIGYAMPVRRCVSRC